MANAQELRRGAGEREARDAGHQGAETMERGGEALVQGTETTAGNVTRAVRSGSETMVDAARKITEMQQPMAEAARDEAGRMAEMGERMAAACREAAERGMADMQACFTAATIFGQGMQRLQSATIEAMGKRMDSWRERPQAMLRARDPREIMQLQRDMLRDWIGFMTENGSTQLHIVSEITQEAMKPLLQRADQPRQTRD